jgi:hypothetical protein
MALAALPAACLYALLHVEVYLPVCVMPFMTHAHNLIEKMPSHCTPSASICDSNTSSWAHAPGALPVCHAEGLCTLVMQGLGEIAFCAVAANQQVRGFGTRLMNHTKAMARDRDSLTHFLTYADNNAVGYFTKQVSML